MAVSLTASPFNFCTASAHRIQGEQTPFLSGSFLLCLEGLFGFFFTLHFPGLHLRLLGFKGVKADLWEVMK